MAGKTVYGGHTSDTARVVKLKAYGSDAVLELPIKTNTTVAEVKEIVATKTLTDADDLGFFYKAGAYMTKQKDGDQIMPVTIVKGIKSFSPKRMEWPHPVGIIGQGYHGLKTAIYYLREGNDNIVAFDRNEHVGGYCWITGANKTSRLQTEFGSFHVWWGPDVLKDGKLTYPNCNTQDGWHIWPYKAEIQKHFKLAAQEYGVNPHVYFQSHVSKMEIIGDPKAESRYYALTIEDLKNNNATSVVNVSVIYSYPGSLTQNRIIDYPGEDVFDGEIRYGMNDDTPYDKLKDSSIAILGNGAFAVENARTCLECEGKKAYIITRRKNLASPRIPCWFVHQGPFPTPGGFVLKMFEPMYKLANFGDPWKFWSVHANADRSNVTVLQNSRFGIGDVTFLMCCWGLLEYIVGTVKRFSRHTVHCSGGEKLEDVTIVLKALGLLGDWSVDKLHNMKEMVGPYCSGDWRRPLMIDATGMNAANFTTFSTGIGTTDFVISNKYLHDFPKEYYRIEREGFINALPRHKEEPDIEKPAYLTEVKYSMTGSIILDGMIPSMARTKDTFSRYKYTMYHKTHSFDRTLEVATQEWDAYQATWKARGIQHEYTPYPYTKQMVAEWFKEWSTIFKTPIHPDGPDAVPLPDWVP